MRRKIKVVNYYCDDEEKKYYYVYHRCRHETLLRVAGFRFRQFTGAVMKTQEKNLFKKLLEIVE